MNELYQLRSAIEVLEEESRSLQEHKKLREELTSSIHDHRKLLEQLSGIEGAHQVLKQEISSVQQAHQTLQKEFDDVKHANTLLHQGHTEQQKQLKLLLEHIQRLEKRLWIGGGLLTAGMVAMLLMLLGK